MSYITPSYLTQTVSSRIRYHNNGLKIIKDYDIMAAYNVGDVVHVWNSIEYKYPFDPRRNSSYSTSTHIVGGTLISKYTGKLPNDYSQFATPNVIPTPGKWKCVSPVPSLNWMLFLYGYSILGDPLTQLQLLANGSVPQNRYNDIGRYLKYIRLMDVNYLPTFPEPASKAYLDINNLSKAKGRYWELISIDDMGGYLACSDGNVKDQYIDQLNNSGSYDQLPSTNLITTI